MRVDLERFLLISFRELNFSERSGYAYGVSKALTGVGFIIDSVPIFWLAERYHRRTMALAEQIQLPGALGRAYLGFAAHKACLGDLDVVIEYEQRAARMYQEKGDLHGWASPMYGLCWALDFVGDFTQALIHGREMEIVGRDGADHYVQLAGLEGQGRALLHLGQLDEAISLLRRTVDLAEAILDRGVRVNAGAYLGRCYLQRGDLEQALSVLLASEQFRIEHGGGPFSPVILCNGLAEAYLMAAERSDALPSSEKTDWLGKARRACRDALKNGKGVRPGLPEAMRLRGTYEWLKGKPAPAQKWWRRSMALAEERGHRYDLGMAHLEMGRRLGERAHLEQAEAMFAEIGAEWDLARAREALGEVPAT
jgi:tetratricopeptide (TPR) repeat protein